MLLESGQVIKGGHEDAPEAGMDEGTWELVWQMAWPNWPQKVVGQGLTNHTQIKAPFLGVVRPWVTSCGKTYDQVSPPL